MGSFAQYEWLLGALFALVGSICSNFGVNIQKYGFMKNEALPAHEQQPYSKQPTWVLGLLLIIIGSLGDFVALGLAAQSIVAPIGSSTLVSNIFFAYFWLHEELSFIDLLGTVCIIGGSTLAVLFGDHEVHVYTLEELESYYLQEGFIIYASACVAIMTVAYVMLRGIEHRKLKVLSLSAEYDLAMLQDDHMRMIVLDTEIDAAERDYEPYIKLHPLCYCVIAGTMGAQNILFGKIVAELVETTFRGKNQLFFPMTYVFTACMLATIFCQLHFLAKALQYFDAMYVVPVFQCFWISVSTIAGAAYFSEFSSFSSLQAIAFTSGILLTLSGVIILSNRDMSKNKVPRNTQQYVISQKVSRNPALHTAAQPVRVFGGNRKYGLARLEEEPDEQLSGDESEGEYAYGSAAAGSLGGSFGVDGLVSYQGASTPQLNVDQVHSEAPDGQDKLQAVEEVIVTTDSGRGYVAYVPRVANSQQRRRILQEAKERFNKNQHGYSRPEDVGSHKIRVPVRSDDGKRERKLQTSSDPAQPHVVSDTQEELEQHAQDKFVSPKRVDDQKSVGNATRQGRSKSAGRKGARTTVQKSRYARMRAASLYHDEDGTRPNRGERHSMDADHRVSRSTRRKSSGSRARGHSVETREERADSHQGDFSTQLPVLSVMSAVGVADKMFIDAWDKLPSLPLPSFLEGKSSTPSHHTVRSEYTSVPTARDSPTLQTAHATDQDPYDATRKLNFNKEDSTSYGGV